MSDWQVGDLAVCSIADGWFGYDHGSQPSFGSPEKNGVYRVRYIKRRDGMEFLRFDEFGGKGWNATAFRKIRPDAHEACEPEFITLLRRVKRKVAA